MARSEFSLWTAPCSLIVIGIGKSSYLKLEKKISQNNLQIFEQGINWTEDEHQEEGGHVDKSFQPFQKITFNWRLNPSIYKYTDPPTLLLMNLTETKNLETAYIALYAEL